MARRTASIRKAVTGTRGSVVRAVFASAKRWTLRLCALAVGALAASLASAAASDLNLCVGLPRLDITRAVTIDPGRIPGTSGRRVSAGASSVRVEVFVSGPRGVDLRGRVLAELVADTGGTPVALTATARPGIYAATVSPGRYMLSVTTASPPGVPRLDLATPSRRALLDQKVNEIAVELAPRDKLFYRMGNSLVPFTAPDRVALVLPGLGVGPGALNRKITLEQLDRLAKSHGGTLDPKFLKGPASAAIVFDSLSSRSASNLIAELKTLEPSTSLRVGGGLIDADGRLTVIDNRFVFRLVHGMDTKRLGGLLSLFGVSILKVSPDDPDVVIVAFRKNDLSANLATVNCLVEQGLLVTGEPDLVRPWIGSSGPPIGWPNDPDYATTRGSTNLKNQGIVKAWDLLFDPVRQLVGKSTVKVGILDWPVDPEDPDLKCDVDGEAQLKICWDPARFYDTGNGSCPSLTLPSHGSTMLGIIAACTNNGLGVAGIAPGVRLHALGFRLSFESDYFSTDDYTNKLRWMAGFVTPCPSRSAGREDPCRWPLNAGADVINNSYQMIPPSGWNHTAPIAMPEVVATLFQRLESKGRQGMGTVLVFAAGNYGDTETTPIVIGRPTQIINPLAADPRTIAVSNCLLNGTDERLYRGFGSSLPSNFGDRIDVCADGEGTLPIPSGCAGISPCPATGGTSSAAATVTGIVALILSANPNLHSTEVRHILRETADKIDCDQADPDGQWIGSESKWYGAGRVNAFDAVKAALNGLGPPKTCPPATP